MAASRVRRDAQLEQYNATPGERLAAHRAISRPLLNQLCLDAKASFDDRRVEPNSDLGGAYTYLLNQQHALMAFTRHEGIPLTNNEDERAIKTIVLVRKNSQNFTSPVGAAIADVIWTCGATTLRAGDRQS